MRGRSAERFLENWESSLSELIGSDETRLGLWVRVLDLLLVVRNIRAGRSFSLDGRISHEDKISFFRDLIAQSLGEPSPENLERLLVPLVEGNLWDVLPFLKGLLVCRFDAKVGRVAVEISSPGPLGTDIQGKILKALDAVVNSEEGRADGVAKPESKDQKLTVRPVWNQKPDLLAGLEIRIGSRVWDSSLSARLRELERQLLVQA